MQFDTNQRIIDNFAWKHHFGAGAEDIYYCPDRDDVPNLVKMLGHELTDDEYRFLETRWDFWYECAHSENTQMESKENNMIAPCPDCGGSGELHRGNMDAGLSMGSTEECDLCGGTGEKPTTEGYNFDKFMDAIQIHESSRRTIPTTSDSPQRLRASRHQERPLSRIRYGSKLMSTTTIKTGRSLNTFLKTLVEESVKSSLYQRSLQEKDKQDSISGDSTQDDTSSDDSHSSKTMEDDTEAMKSGDVTVDDVIEKLNSIRSGHSFRDDKVKGNMEQYVNSLSKAEKTALLAFLKGISQIVTGEIPSSDAVDPSSNPSDVKMKKGPAAPETKHIKPNVIKAKMPKTEKSTSSEDTSGPVPITPKKK